DRRSPAEAVQGLARRRRQPKPAQPLRQSASQAVESRAVRQSMGAGFHLALGIADPPGGSTATGRRFMIPVWPSESRRRLGRWPAQPGCHAISPFTSVVLGCKIMGKMAMSLLPAGTPAGLVSDGVSMPWLTTAF